MVPIASGILYPGFGILLSPVLAAAAMRFSSLSVVGNALRLRTKPVQVSFLFFYFGSVWDLSVSLVRRID